MLIGIYGPPTSGKSTLIRKLRPIFMKEGRPWFIISSDTVNEFLFDFDRLTPETTYTILDLSNCILEFLLSINCNVCVEADIFHYDNKNDVVYYISPKFLLSLGKKYRRHVKIIDLDISKKDMFNRLNKRNSHDKIIVNEWFAIKIYETLNERETKNYYDTICNADQAYEVIYKWIIKHHVP